MTTHYETLGIPRTSTIDEIRSAYILKAKTVHPDVITRTGEATSDFIEVHEAYKIIGRGDTRKAYDAWLDEVYKPCLKCSGRGVLIITKSFKERSVRPCLDCKGSGTGEKK